MASWTRLVQADSKSKLTHVLHRQAVPVAAVRHAAATLLLLVKIVQQLEASDEGIILRLNSTLRGGTAASATGSTYEPPVGF
jgi:hypothetical protein